MIKTVISIIPILIISSVSLADAFCFDQAAAEFGLSSELLKAIASQESSMNPRAVAKNSNGSRDLGLMQINSSWIRRIGLDESRLLDDACYNVKTGAKILAECIGRKGYSWEAVGCFNAVSRHRQVDYSWQIMRRVLSRNEKKPLPDQPVRINLSDFPKDSDNMSAEQKSYIVVRVRDLNQDRE